MKKEITYFTILGILVGILVLQQCKYKDLESKLWMKETNEVALKDTIRETKNLLKKEQYEKISLIVTKEDLKNLNEDLSKEVDAQKGKVAQLQILVATLKTPKAPPSSGQPKPDSPKKPCDTLINYIVNWSFPQKFDEYNFRNLAGTTKFSIDRGVMKTSISEVTLDEISFNIITGLKKKDDYYEIFVRSDYPGFKPSRIEGAFIPQKDLYPPSNRKRWTVGPGFQIGMGGSYSPSLRPSWYFGLGIGIQYNWVSF